MIVALDDHNILRLVNANPNMVNVVKATIDRFWQLGLEAEGQIGHQSSKRQFDQEDEQSISWEFVLKGSPWSASSTKVGHSRQFVTFLLDALLFQGWTVVTGLDISRTQNKKSALLFQRCPPVRNLHHVCLSPLGKQRFQLINAPASLRQLVKDEFEDVLGNERLSEDESLYEIEFEGRSWWVTDPEAGFAQDSYIFVRNRMRKLLQSLMDSGWRVIASADVARQTQDDKDDVGQGIHSWFIIFCGLNDADYREGEGASQMRITANSVLKVGSARDESHSAVGSQRSGYKRSTIAGARSASLTRRKLSPVPQRMGSIPRRSRTPSPPGYEDVTKARRRKSHYDTLV
jgi:hypothetical protein